VEALAAARVAPGAREAVNSYDDAGQVALARGQGSTWSAGTVVSPGPARWTSSEWLQQITAAVRTCAPVAVLLDVIQPFPTFSEAIVQALGDLDRQIAQAAPGPIPASATS